MLVRLSELLRMALDDDGAPETPLRQELEFIRRYLELEQMRLGDRLVARLEIDPDTLDAAVPKLLLQPLVENAVRHGIAPYSTPGEICVQARRENGSLLLRVTDTGPLGAPEKAASDGAGVGLKNTRARLREMYGNAQQFELKKTDRGGWIVEIAIPFRASEEPGAQIEVEYEDSHAHR